jgi:hypothetical protein
MTHDKENVLTAVRGETASHPLYRAPLSTHGNCGTLCRAPPGSAHGKEWSRRMVDHALCLVDLPRARTGLASRRQPWPGFPAPRRQPRRRWRSAAVAPTVSASCWTARQQKERGERGRCDPRYRGGCHARGRVLSHLASRSGHFFSLLLSLS